MPRTWNNWNWTDWTREDQAENGVVILPQLQVITYMSSMNNKEKDNGCLQCIGNMSLTTYRQAYQGGMASEQTHGNIQFILS